MVSGKGGPRAGDRDSALLSLAFFDAPWQTCLEHVQAPPYGGPAGRLQSSVHLLKAKAMEYFERAHGSQRAAASLLPSKGIQRVVSHKNLVVQLQDVERIGTWAVAKLRDPTGFIRASFTTDTYQRHRHVLLDGCVALLTDLAPVAYCSTRRIGFSRDQPEDVCHVSITEENVKQLFPRDLEKNPREDLGLPLARSLVVDAYASSALVGSRLSDALLAEEDCPQTASAQNMAFASAQHSQPSQEEHSACRGPSLRNSLHAGVSTTSQGSQHQASPEDITLSLCAEDPRVDIAEGPCTFSREL